MYLSIRIVLKILLNLRLDVLMNFFLIKKKSVLGIRLISAQLQLGLGLSLAIKPKVEVRLSCGWGFDKN